MTSSPKVLKLSDVVLSSFHNFWREVRKAQKTFFVCKGGRNSAKSSTIGQKIIMEIIEHPISAVIYRKVANTLEGSVYEQLKEATMQLGVEDQFMFYKSPLKIVYKERGNSIIFRGADDPEKSKSIKMSKFPIAIAWFEEVTEFKTEEEWDVIVDSILRQSLVDFTYKIFVSYNPPKRKQHWVNKKWETQFIDKNTYVHHSTFLDNKYLSKQTIEKIEETKKKNPHKYKWMYLGEPIGGGIVPFENLNFRAITDEEVNQFDNIRQGLDWGYSVDPVAFVKMHYDKTRRKLYIFDEIYGVKVSNNKLATKMIEKDCDDEMTTADSSEPKSIAELKSLGIKCRAAKKGKGSVEYGEKWLDDLEEIIIDHQRAPNTAREMENIDYQVDRNGDIVPKLEDRDNHTIDAIRYGCESDMKANTLQFG